jgi:hypothetical protein
MIDKVEAESALDAQATLTDRTFDIRPGFDDLVAANSHVDGAANAAKRAKRSNFPLGGNQIFGYQGTGRTAFHTLAAGLADRVRPGFSGKGAHPGMISALSEIDGA